MTNRIKKALKMIKMGEEDHLREKRRNQLKTDAVTSKSLNGI